VGDHPLRPPSHRSLGGLLPRQLANGTHDHPPPPELYPLHHAVKGSHGVLIRLSAGYPPAGGRFHTRYAPVRRSPPGIATRAAPRLACVRPAASVHPEPGSNSSLLLSAADLPAAALRSMNPKTIPKNKITVPLFRWCQCVKELLCLSGPKPFLLHSIHKPVSFDSGLQR
jgi:hypothetical protein